MSNDMKMYNGYVDDDHYYIDEQPAAAALETVKAQLSGDVQKYIQSNFGDLDEWITTQIEAAIYDLKNKPSEVANASA